MSDEVAKGGSDDEVVLFVLRPEEVRPAQRQRLRACLSGAERERRDTYVFMRDRTLFELAHGLKRLALADALDARPEELCFDLGPHQKPALTEPWAHLRFNLSHTEGLIAVALRRAHDVGVDVERQDRELDPVSLASTVLSAAERASLLALPLEHRRHHFFRLWTLKEAYIKARGLGVTLDLQSFSFELSHGITLRPPPDDHAVYDFFASDPTEHHLLAACAPRSRAAPVRFRLGDIGAVLG